MALGSQSFVFPTRVEDGNVGQQQGGRLEKTMDETLCTSGEVAAEVELPRWRFLYLIEKDVLPGPSYAVPGRRLFTARDVEDIREALSKYLSGRSSGTPDDQDQQRSDSKRRGSLSSPQEEDLK